MIWPDWIKNPHLQWAIGSAIAILGIIVPIIISCFSKRSVTSTKSEDNTGVSLSDTTLKVSDKGVVIIGQNQEVSVSQSDPKYEELKEKILEDSSKKLDMLGIQLQKKHEYIRELHNTIVSSPFSETVLN